MVDQNFKGMDKKALYFTHKEIGMIGRIELLNFGIFVPIELQLALFGLLVDFGLILYLNWA